MKGNPVPPVHTKGDDVMFADTDALRQVMVAFWETDHHLASSHTVTLKWLSTPTVQYLKKNNFAGRPQKEEESFANQLKPYINSRYNK